MKENVIINKGHQFLSIRKIEDLAYLLGYKSAFLKSVAFNPEYNAFKIPKKQSGFREIESPCPFLKKIQNSLNTELQCVYFLFRPEYVNGFIINPENIKEKTGIISNARAHIGKSNILNIDIEDFFHSFSAEKVWKLFRNSPFNFPDPLAYILTMLTTWYDKLPVGSPTSPVLSNFLTFDLDNKLSSITRDNNGIYTRYADDMTFSFDKWIAVETVQQIKMLIEKEGFRINNKKFRIQSCNSRQTVTGLVVNEKVNIDRRYIRQVRAILFDCRKNGINKAAARYLRIEGNPDIRTIQHFKKSLSGRIQYIGMVRGKNDRIFNNIVQEYNTLF